MRQATTLRLGAVALCLAGAPLLAHEVTYRGTVITVEAAKIQVRVIDEKSKKETLMDFAVTAKTRVLRGSKTVPFAEARIQKDERISVTVNNDEEGPKAITIRLAAAK
ncbi:MAG TPA: hypothetical protein VES67_20285 [Vicinamibacterales bacterium]|nr:hypothetical protein [Vicinamibacterales bacterium]